MQGFDLNLLKALDALLEERSVTRAAARLGVSQPTMSGMLARLRDELRDPVLVRTGQNMELSNRGAQMATEVHQTLLQIEQLTAPQGELDHGTLRRHFRIMASEFGLYLILPSVFARMRRDAPFVTVEVLPIEKPVDRVYTGGVDLCLTGDLIGEVGGEMSSAVRVRKLTEDKFVGLVADDHPLRGCASLDEILSYPHVATQFPGSAWAVEDIGIEGLSTRHPPGVRVPSFLAIGPMVADTDGIGVLPSRLGSLACASGGLRILRLPPEFATIPIRALWHSRHDQDPALRWLLDLMADVCAGLDERHPAVAEPTLDRREMVHQCVDEDPHLGGKTAPARIECVDFGPVGIEIG